MEHVISGTAWFYETRSNTLRGVLIDDNIHRASADKLARVLGTPPPKKDDITFIIEEFEGFEDFKADNGEDGESCLVFYDESGAPLSWWCGAWEDREAEAMMDILDADDNAEEFVKYKRMLT